MTERKLPAGWAWTNLNEVTQVTMGQSPPGESIHTTPDGVPFLQGKAEFGSRTPTFAKWTTKPARFARSGDILLSVRAPVGAVNIAPDDCAIGRGLASLRASDAIDARFLYYFVVASRPILELHATGTTFAAIGGSTVRTHAVPLPPVPEQHRIVEALEDYLSCLDAAEQSLSIAAQRLSPLRKSAIQMALDQELDVEEGTSAAERLECILADRVALASKRRAKPVDPAYELDLPAGWVTASVDQLCWDIQYGTSSKTGELRDDSDRPVLRMGNIQDGDIDPQNLKYLPKDDPSIDGLLLEAGDLLFNRTNSAELVGKTAVFSDQLERATFASYLIRCRPVPGVNAQWISHIANSPMGRHYITSVMSQQVGQANVNGTKLAAMPIPVAPQDVEAKILDEISEVRSSSARLGDSVEAAKARSAALRRSLLLAAFSGELVDQDPTDEPADVALIKIREQQWGTVPRRRRKVVAAK